MNNYTVGQTVYLIQPRSSPVGSWTVKTAVVTALPRGFAVLSVTKREALIRVPNPGPLNFRVWWKQTFWAVSTEPMLSLEFEWPGKLDHPFSGLTKTLKRAYRTAQQLKRPIRIHQMQEEIQEIVTKYKKLL